MIDHRTQSGWPAGFDVLLDASLRPWLMEVNTSPQLAAESPLDIAIKSSVMCELLNLVGFATPPPPGRRAGGRARQGRAAEPATATAAEPEEPQPQTELPHPGSGPEAEAETEGSASWHATGGEALREFHANSASASLLGTQGERALLLRFEAEVGRVGVGPARTAEGREEQVLRCVFPSAATVSSYASFLELDLENALLSTWVRHKAACLERRRGCR